MPSTASTINQKHQLTGWVAVAVMTFSRVFLRLASYSPSFSDDGLEL